MFASKAKINFFENLSHGAALNPKDAMLKKNYFQKITVPKVDHMKLLLFPSPKHFNFCIWATHRPGQSTNFLTYLVDWPGLCSPDLKRPNLYAKIKVCWGWKKKQFHMVHFLCERDFPLIIFLNIL